MMYKIEGDDGYTRIAEDIEQLPEPEKINAEKIKELKR